MKSERDWDEYREQFNTFMIEHEQRTKRRMLYTKIAVTLWIIGLTYILAF